MSKRRMQNLKHKYLSIEMEKCTFKPNSARKKKRHKSASSARHFAGNKITKLRSSRSQDRRVNLSLSEDEWQSPINVAI